MVGATGLEQAAKSPEKPAPAKTGGAISGAFPADSGPAAPVSAAPDPTPDVPPDLADLARRLAALPEAVRASLLAATQVRPEERKV
jgi:hypothetical protein